MKKYLLLLTLIPLISFGQITNEKTITVIGISEMDIDPDIITLSMTVKETENTKKESDIVNLENKLLEFLASLGIDKSNLTVNRYTARDQIGSKFKQDKSYNLIIPKSSLVDTIVAKSIEVGMDNLYISKIDHSQIDLLRNDLLVKALDAAMTKANIIAKQMGLSLGKVSMVNEQFRLVDNSQSNYDNNVYLTADEIDVIGYGRGRSSSIRSSSTISLEKLHLSKTVIVKYEID
jgi:uncharacterized protein YggE